MDVAAHDPYVDPAQADVRLMGLDDLLAWADFVSVHLPGGRKLPDSWTAAACRSCGPPRI